MEPSALAQDHIPSELLEIRGSIDNLDTSLIHLLAERFKLTKRVGHLKAQQSMNVSDPGREARQVARLRKLASDADLDPDFAEKFIRFVIEEVIRHHETFQNGDS